MIIIDGYVPFFLGGARGVNVIVFENGHSDSSVLQVKSVLFTEDTVTSRATSSQEDRKYASA